MRLRTSVARTTLIALAMLCTSFVLAAEFPTVKLGGGWIALGVGANWGDGMLTFDGYEYPFSIKGLSIGDFGAAGFTGSGTVHNLTRAEDFNGKYTTVGARVTVLAGGSTLTMRNQKGVSIDLVIATPGFKVSLGEGGIEMEIPTSRLVAVRALKNAEGSAARSEAAGRRMGPPRQAWSRRQSSTREGKP